MFWHRMDVPSNIQNHHFARGTKTNRTDEGEDFAFGSEIESDDDNVSRETHQSSRQQRAAIRQHSMEATWKL